MKNDIKKKFIDILFEPEEDEDEVGVVSGPEFRPVRKQDVPVTARDILYRRQEQSAFIDLNEGKKKGKEKEEEVPEYEFSSQISPIFGVIKENKPDINPSVPANEVLINKPDSSHLEIVPSPVYGYGSRDDYEKDRFDINEVLTQTDEEELHRLLDDDYGYDDHTYDDIDDADDDQIDLFSPFGEDL